MNSGCIEDHKISNIFCFNTNYCYYVILYLQFHWFDISSINLQYKKIKTQKNDLVRRFVHTFVWLKLFSAYMTVKFGLISPPPPPCLRSWCIEHCIICRLLKRAPMFPVKLWQLDAAFLELEATIPPPRLRGARRTGVGTTSCRWCWCDISWNLTCWGGWKRPTSTPTERRRAAVKIPGARTIC